MAATATDVRRFVFVFPMASGHVNPSLPLARELGCLGHEVHYICADQMREAIEDTGAVFHDYHDVEPELWGGRPQDLMGMYSSLKKEFGLESLPFTKALTFLRNITLEMKIPGVIRLLQDLRPSAVVYCPLSCAEAAWASKDQGIPYVGLNTIAGPGAWTHALNNFAATMQTTVEDLDEAMRGFQAGVEAHKRLQAKYGLPGDGGIDKPFGMLPHTEHAAVTLVTTTEDFYDPITPELREAIEAGSSNSVAVGPLLDKDGAKRAVGHRSTQHEKVEDCGMAAAEVLAKVLDARAAGRRVVLASMGTVITGDLGFSGWTNRLQGADGPRSLTGKQLCQGAWGGVFDAFGAEAAGEGPLIVVSLGPQSDALDGLSPPGNAICCPSVPQVDLLKAGVDLFLTHGGQNSFTEAIANGTPLVVCPGFGDQPVNAQKAVDMGVGLKVDRPDCEVGQDSERLAAEAFRADVKSALLAVCGDQDFKVKAVACGRNLQAAGGVPKAVELVLAASGKLAALAAEGGA